MPLIDLIGIAVSLWLKAIAAGIWDIIK